MDKLSLEASMKRLDEIVKLLEKNDESLEKSIELFKEGMELSKTCHQQLSEFEKQIVEVMETNQEVE